MRVTIKLQLCDMNNFIHKDFLDRSNIRYVKRLTDTKMSKEDLTSFQNNTSNRLHSMATYLDERFVDWRIEFDMIIIKVASTDNND